MLLFNYLNAPSLADYARIGGLDSKLGFLGSSPSFFKPSIESLDI